VGVRLSKSQQAAGRHLDRPARSQRLAPAPVNRARVEKLARQLDRLLVLDREAIAALSAHWSTADYRRWLLADGDGGNRAIWLALGLGSRPCGHFIESL